MRTHIIGPYKLLTRGDPSGGVVYMCVCVCFYVCYKVHFSCSPPLGPGLHLLPSISQMSCVLLTLLTAWKKINSNNIFTCRLGPKSITPLEAKGNVADGNRWLWKLVFNNDNFGFAQRGKKVSSTQTPLSTCLSLCTCKRVKGCTLVTAGDRAVTGGGMFVWMYCRSALWLCTCLCLIYYHICFRVVFHLSS